MSDRDEQRRVMNGQDGQRRVVVIGGGFAGLFAVRALRRAPVSVTLIDRAPYRLFQPLLYQCATGILSEGKIAPPVRTLLRKYRNVECVLAEVTGLDAGSRRVLATRPYGEQLEFGYDYLIVAAGVQQSYSSPSPWSAPGPPASGWPGRSGNSPAGRCATSTAAASPRTPGSCCSTAAMPRSPRSARNCRSKRPGSCPGSVSSST